MTVKFNITPRAKADLNNIWDYTVDTWSEEQANKYITALFERFGWISMQPYVGKHRVDIHDDYYCFSQGQHVIFYLIRDNSIDIIGVPHRSMDIVNFFDD
jgi:toxin ParE1/3/4